MSLPSGPTGEEIRKVRQWECRTQGHDYHIIASTIRTGPSGITCSRCGQSSGRERTIMTPREQLTEAITQSLHASLAPPSERARLVTGIPPQIVDSVLDALSDLGAVVLMPVKREGLPDRAMYYSRNDFGVLNASWVGLELAYEDLAETAYINALESEQS